MANPSSKHLLVVHDPESYHRDPLRLGDRRTWGVDVELSKHYWRDWMGQACSSDS